MTSTAKSLLRLRKLHIGAALDFEFFARSSAVMTYLSGAAVRVGLHSFAREGLYRGDLMTHRLVYNPHIHTSQTFQVMVDAVDAPPGSLPALDMDLPAVQSYVPSFRPSPQDLHRLRSVVEQAAGDADFSPLVLLYANASDLLPLRRWPAYSGGWIWDDATSVYSNPVVTKPDGLYRIWLTTEDYDFWPMTKTVFWTEYQFFKDDPAGYHKVNIALHAAACVLIYLVLRRLAVPGAALAGLVFALHPVNAASVAWVAELKNVLSMIVLALTVLSWLRFEGRQSRLWYALTLLAYAAALASKTSVVMFPIMLLGLVCGDAVK